MIETATYEAFRAALNELVPGWVLTADGIAGPAEARVRLDQRHASTGEGHVDVQFVLDDGAPGPTELWDCALGWGTTPAERAQFAAKVWADSTAAALLELKYSRRGQFADHYHDTDAEGFSGWHVIMGGIVGFGEGDSSRELQKWWLANPFLPTLARALAESLHEEDCPQGLKILFGGNDVAEVRLNGEHHEAASAALAELSWPRLHPPGFVRSYVLVLHRESSP